jgi:hypothetical protein
MQATIASTDAEGVLFFSAHQGQANRPGPGPGLLVRHAVSADLFDAIGLVFHADTGPVGSVQFSRARES